MPNNKFLPLLLLVVLATIPLLFGARHPLIQGVYSSLILVSCGVWAVLNIEQFRAGLKNTRLLLAAALLCYIFVTALPVPAFLLQILSPTRAASLLSAATTLEIDPLTSISYYAEETRFYAVYLASLFLLFLCSSTLLRKESYATATLWVICALGTIEAAYGLLQAMIPELGVLWLPSIVGAEGCARGTIIYRNQYGAFLNMCWPMGVVLAIRLDRLQAQDSLPGKPNGEKPAQRLARVFNKAMLPLLGSAFMIMAVLFSRSRGGIVSLLLIAGILLFLLPVSRRIKGLTGGAFLLFTMIYGGMIGFQQVINRFLFFYESALERLELWLDSLSILKDHLLTGIGMGAYKLVSPVYLRKVSSTAWYDFAHNEYVELMIELGLPAMVLLLAWTMWGLYNYGRLLSRDRQQTAGIKDFKSTTLLAIGSYCSILGFLFHGFVDFIWRLPANSFYAVTLLAMLSASLAPESTDEKS